MIDREVETVHGVERFRRNRAVDLIVNAAQKCGCFDYNRLWHQYQDPVAFGISREDAITDEDMREFYQMIGYSVCGFDEVFAGTEDDA